MWNIPPYWRSQRRLVDPPTMSIRTDEWIRLPYDIRCLGLLLTVGALRWAYQSKNCTRLDGNQQTTKFLCSAGIVIVMFLALKKIHVETIKLVRNCFSIIVWGINYDDFPNYILISAHHTGFTPSDQYNLAPICTNNIGYHQYWYYPFYDLHIKISITNLIFDF